MPFQIAFVSLKKIGGSIGLALAAYPEILTCIGYDQDTRTARAAAKLGAITKSYLTPHRCIQESKVIILGCPIYDLEENLQLIAVHAPDGAVVIDPSVSKTQVAEWARKILPEELSLIHI